ncbi:Transcription factor GRAS [Macleaya cordata]|uniref:Transcription factor GRAS n=1 Tax=Macleaya cordata TaxID=56857 RepID=A0A200QCZ9_MACCD|nr:Transcription factor GRAS [Macleaya cordata]
MITMTINGESDPNHTSDHILDWLEDTISFLPSFFDDPYNNSTTPTVSDITEFQWWDQDDQDLIINPSLISPTTTTTTTAAAAAVATTNLTNLPPAPPLNSKKRKSPNDPNLETVLPLTNHHQNQQNQRRRLVGTTKKPTIKSSTGNSSNNKEGRWAEQLLNPCASAITAGNLTRVQHLLYVLHELASSSGDANHRLATYGLRALTHHLSSVTSSVTPTNFSSVAPTSTFASTEPRLFQRSLLKFYEVSPWFTFANTIANSSILQILSQLEPDSSSRNLHILDIGVSHGIQWPTLLEALSRRSGGPPPLLRLTIVNSNTDHQNYSTSSSSAPFSVGPPGDDFPTRLLRFAKSINLNLQINQINNHPLQTLTPQVINTSPSETLIVCTQFRLHNLNHNNNNPDDERTEFLKFLVKLEPSAVILCENDIECSCNQCGDFATGFSRRVGYLWRFLDSTSCAFKGRECEERRVVEAEAATALMSEMEMNEGREKWCEKMRGLGFVGEGFGEDAIDGGRALLRKYDSNWEMKVDERDGCVCLWWKGQRVSFCSLWKLGEKC